MSNPAFWSQAAGQLLHQQDDGQPEQAPQHGQALPSSAAQLQQQLQASLATAGQVSSLSLLDFLG